MKMQNVESIASDKKKFSAELSDKYAEAQRELQRCHVQVSKLIY